MRVLLISKWVAGATPGDFFYPGVWRDTFELAITLKQAGVVVAVLTPQIHHLHQKRFHQEFGQSFKKNHIPHFIAKTKVAFGSTWGNFRFRLLFAELVALRRFKPHLVQYMQFGPTLLYPFLGKTPLLFYSCYLFNSYPDEAKDLAAKKKAWGTKDTARSMFLLHSIQNVFYLICARLFGSYSLKDSARRQAVLVLMHRQGFKKVQKQFGQKTKVIYIQKGVNLQEASRYRKKFPQKKSSSPKRVLFIGSILHGKGVFDLLQSFKVVQKRVKHSQLIIAGTGPRSLVTKVKQSIARNRLRAKYVASLTASQRWHFLGLSQVFCLPSYLDADPAVLLEAQAAGLPIVTSREIDSPVKPGQTGLKVAAGNIQALSQALVTLLLSDKKRSQMSKHALAAAKNYDWHKSAKKFLKLYQKLTPK